MRLHPDVIGVLTSESLRDIFGEAVSITELRAYRAYFQERIEDEYSVICSFTTRDHGELELHVQPQVAYRLSESELYNFERKCRAGFRSAHSAQSSAPGAMRDSSR
jgi:hypothetical protein